MAASPFEIDVPSTLLIGTGASLHVAREARRLGLRRLLVVSDPGVVARGLTAPIVDVLRAEGLTADVFDGVQADPTLANVQHGLEHLRALGADGLVAVGGGSPIDAAKAMAVAAVHSLPLPEMEGYHRVPGPCLPLIAIPTTAGTGSEVTKVAVITDEPRQRKMMLLDRWLLPRVALVDWQLSRGMSPELTAAVGVDTLTHGIEAFVSAKANPLTDGWALQCVSLVSQHLLSAYKQPDHAAAREGMMLAATLGGLAFANASVCLVHGMSRPLGAVFHVPHGLSNAVLLPTVTRFSAPAALARYAQLARSIGCAGPANTDQDAASQLIDYLEQLNLQLGIGRLAECLAGNRSRFESVVAQLARDALASGSPAHNPRPAGEAEIVELYWQAW